jgi:hypothetical protein
MDAIDRISAVIDSRINVAHEYEKHVEVIPANVQYNSTNADGAGGFGSQIVFSQIITPSVSNTVLGRDVRVAYNLTVSTPSLSTNANAIKLPLANYDAGYEQHACLTSFPLNASSSTITVQINGQSTGVSQSQVTGPLQRCLPKDKLLMQGSECPSMYDDRALLVNDVAPYGYLQLPAAYAAAATPVLYNGTNVGTVTIVGGNYATALTSGIDGGPTYAVIQNTITVGTVTLPPGAYVPNLLVRTSVLSNIPVNAVSNAVLSKYENCESHATRGSFKPWSYTDDGTTSTWNFAITEAVLVSPFSPLNDREVGLCNVNTMSITFTIANLQSMLYSNIPYVAPTITITNPRILLTYMQVEQIKIPRVQVIDYTAVNYFPKSHSVSFAGVSSVSLSTDQVRLVNQPRKVLFVVRLPIATRYSVAGGLTSSGTDTFLPLGLASNTFVGALSVQIGTRQLFASATIQDLYRMSKMNGIDVPFEQWFYGGSCVFAFTPENFGLSEAQGDVFPGALGTASNNNIQINFTINSQSLAYAGVALPTEVESLIIPLYEGTCNISPSDCQFLLGSLSPSQVAQALSGGDYISTEAIQDTINGGSIFGTVKKVFGMGAKALKTAAQYAKHPIAQGALDYLAGSDEGGRLRGMRKHGKKGGVLAMA